MDQTAHRKKNIFVLGFDERHSADLLQIPDVDRFQFHPLLRSEELIYQTHFAIDEKLDKARAVLNNFEGPIDAIVCHWDFPVTPMAAILCREFDLPSPSLKAILKCAHKYWCRLEQQQAVPENTPDFCAVDPFDDRALESLTVDFPFWLKPIKGYGSMLGFRINNADEFHEALAIARPKIRRIGEPFNELLARVDLPPSVQAVTGNYLIAEQLIHGWELAPEGSIRHGQFQAHGMIDMVRDKNHKSFLRYEYPSHAPRKVQQRATAVAERVLKHIGFDNGCFNMEFFWDEATDDLWVIEINPRISQSHSYQFEQVDGMSNHEIAIHVALGDEPLFRHGDGPYKHAAKFLLRHYTQDDARVTRAPTTADLERLRERQPDTDVTLAVETGQRLSSLPDQDAYSYVLAEVYVAAHTTHAMLEKYREAVALLPFELEPLPLEDTNGS